jgi:hypothetical protein
MDEAELEWVAAMHAFSSTSERLPTLSNVNALAPRALCHGNKMARLPIQTLIATTLIAIVASVAEAQVLPSPPVPHIDNQEPPPNAATDPDASTQRLDPRAARLRLDLLDKDDRLIRCESAIGAAACAWHQYLRPAPSPFAEPIR